MGKITIVGTGVDGAQTLTIKGRNAVTGADMLIGAKRMLEPFSDLGKETVCEYRTNEIVRIIKENEDKNIAALMSGDSGFFSGAEKLYAGLSAAGLTAEIICGISSLSYFASRIHLPWQNMKIVSLHGAEANIARAAAGNRLVFFLLGGEATPRVVCRRLCEYGLGEIRVYVGAELGYASEQIISGTASELSDCEISGLSVLVTENDIPENGIRFGICDSEFIRSKVPMTKSEVRSVIMSKLNVPENGICWDIGCGTGSVSIEMAIACREGKIFSIDRNPEAVELTVMNAQKFHCDNIKTVCCSAPDGLSDFPAPDRIFIGGAGGNVKEILEAAYKLNKSAAAIVTAVSLETLSEASAVFRELGIVPEIVELSVTRTKLIGSHTMLSAENPVFIIKGVGA